MQLVAQLTALAVLASLALFQLWCRIEDQAVRGRLKR
jgi:hypothetical protein